MEMMDLAVKDSVFDPSLDPNISDLTVTVRQAKKPLYKVWIYLEGKDLPFIESVTYTLHKTFADPVRTVRRTSANPMCELVIWTWGLFEVAARVIDRQGQAYDFSHSLTYGNELRQGGLKYEYE